MYTPLYYSNFQLSIFNFLYCLYNSSYYIIYLNLNYSYYYTFTHRDVCKQKSFLMFFQSTLQVSNWPTYRNPPCHHRPPVAVVHNNKYLVNIINWIYLDKTYEMGISIQPWSVSRSSFQVRYSKWYLINNFAIKSGFIINYNHKF